MESLMGWLWVSSCALAQFIHSIHLKNIQLLCNLVFGSCHHLLFQLCYWFHFLGIFTFLFSLSVFRAVLLMAFGVNFNFNAKKTLIWLIDKTLLYLKKILMDCTMKIFSLGHWLLSRFLCILLFYYMHFMWTHL